jgi:hypothetical protein
MDSESGANKEGLNGGAMRPAPPPIWTDGGTSRAPAAAPRSAQGLFESFGQDYRAIPGPLTLARVLEGLLKAPGSLAWEIMQGRAGEASAALAVILSLCMLAYGLIMGSFSGGMQLALVPVKVLGGTWLALLICLPSLYVFSCLSGARQTLGTLTALYLQAVTLSGVLLIGFAPVAWLFAQSTRGVAFMGFLHILFWFVSALFSLRLLGTALRYLNQRGIAVLRVWGVVFVLVVFQVSTMLRPLVGPAKGLQWQEKQFFLAHWFDEMD